MRTSERPWRLDCACWCSGEGPDLSWKDCSILAASSRDEKVCICSGVRRSVSGAGARIPLSLETGAALLPEATSS